MLKLALALAFLSCRCGRTSQSLRHRSSGWSKLSAAQIHRLPGAVRLALHQAQARCGTEAIRVSFLTYLPISDGRQLITIHFATMASFVRLLTVFTACIELTAGSARYLAGKGSRNRRGVFRRQSAYRNRFQPRKQHLQPPIKVERQKHADLEKHEPIGNVSEFALLPTAQDRERVQQAQG